MRRTKPRSMNILTMLKTSFFQLLAFYFPNILQIEHKQNQSLFIDKKKRMCRLGHILFFHKTHIVYINYIDFIKNLHNAYNLLSIKGFKYVQTLCRYVQISILVIMQHLHDIMCFLYFY